MINDQFYQLIGSIESACAFLERSIGGAAPDGKTPPEWAKLRSIKDALLEAEGRLSRALYEGKRTGNQAAPDGQTPTDKAWQDFNDAMAEQAAAFASVARDLMKQQTAPQTSDAARAAGSEEWEMMDLRLRRIFDGFGGSNSGMAQSAGPGSSGDFPWSTSISPIDF